MALEIELDANDETCMFPACAELSRLDGQCRCNRDTLLNCYRELTLNLGMLDQPWDESAVVHQGSHMVYHWYFGATGVQQSQTRRPSSQVVKPLHLCGWQDHALCEHVAVLQMMAGMTLSRDCFSTLRYASRLRMKSAHSLNTHLNPASSSMATTSRHPGMTSITSRHKCKPGARQKVNSKGLQQADCLMWNARRAEVGCGPWDIVLLLGHVEPG